MVKKTKASAARLAKKACQSNAKQKKIAAVIVRLEKIEPHTAKAAEAINLFKSWLTDESGYDEKVWPRLKKALQQERERVGARRLFGA